MTEVPQHVTIIMDGNGRWARKQGKQRLFGHKEGVESVRACLEFAVDNGIRYLSIFAFSEENWNRPEEEVSGLMALMFKSVLNEEKTFMRNNARFRVIGDLSRLKPDLLRVIRGMEERTAANTGTTLVVMMSYSGKWDIAQAAGRYAQECVEAAREGREVPSLTEERFATYLSTAGIPEPDLLIRTSGEQRISNYMLWQCAYTEFYFTDVLWPDFRKNEFARALEAFSARDRRYGKIK